MKFAKCLFVSVLVTGFTCPSAWAFDRLNCESSLDKWSVVGAKVSETLLGPKKASETFGKDQSVALIVRDEKGKDIASVTPWNGILFIPGKTAMAQKYKFNFDSDKETWFKLEITAPKSKIKHSLSCRFSF